MIAILIGIRKLWHARLRRLDMKILWPTCLDQARDLDKAKAAFAYHCFNDPAWTDDMTEAEIISFIDGL